MSLQTQCLNPKDSSEEWRNKPHVQKVKNLIPTFSQPVDTFVSWKNTPVDVAFGRATNQEGLPIQVTLIETLHCFKVFFFLSFLLVGEEGGVPFNHTKN